MRTLMTTIARNTGEGDERALMMALSSGSELSKPIGTEDPCEETFRDQADGFFGPEKGFHHDEELRK
jgi:hypothetical protein